MHWKIGDVTVSKVLELEVTGGSRFLLPDAAPDLVRPMQWLVPHFASPEGKLKMSIHALLIQTPQYRIVVDPCLGNDKQNRRVPAWNGRQGSFLQDIADAGFPRESVDFVLCTHLHVDHVGWNTMWADGRWVPTFPNARYLFGRIEYEHWKNQKADELSIPVFEDSVKPVFEAGRADFVETDHRLCEEVQLIPSLGHTPGHVSIVIHSKGERALITGDIAHHPCQLERPDWRATVDHDGDQAEATRRRMFADLCGKQVLVFGTHFAGPSAGWIEANGETWKLRPQGGAA